jgi:hypothetical protein
MFSWFWGGGQSRNDAAGLVSKQRRRVWECHWTHFAAAIDWRNSRHCGQMPPKPAAHLLTQVVHDKGRYRQLASWIPEATF